MFHRRFSESRARGRAARAFFPSPVARGAMWSSLALTVLLFPAQMRAFFVDCHIELAEVQLADERKAFQGKTRETLCGTCDVHGSLRCSEKDG